MDPHPLANLFKIPNYDEQFASELSALDYLYGVLFENHESGNFDEVWKEENYKVVHDIFLNEKHDCHVVSMNSLNINDTNDMQNHKLGDAMLDEDDIFCFPSFGDDPYAIIDHEKNALCDSYIVRFLHDVTENYYERGTYAFTYCNNIKLPLYVFNVLKLCLFCLPMLVNSCSHKLFSHKGSGLDLNVFFAIHDALLRISTTTFYVSIIEIVKPS